MRLYPMVMEDHDSVLWKLVLNFSQINENPNKAHVELYTYNSKPQLETVTTALKDNLSPHVQPSTRETQTGRSLS